MKEARTGWMVAGLGTLVTAAGAALFKRSRMGPVLLGFGLAHVVLGILDRLRPEVRY